MRSIKNEKGDHQQNKQRSRCQKYRVSRSNVEDVITRKGYYRFNNSTGTETRQYMQSEREKTGKEVTRSSNQSFTTPGVYYQSQQIIHSFNADNKLSWRQQSPILQSVIIDKKLLRQEIRSLLKLVTA